MAKRQTIGDNPLDSLIQPISHNGHTTAVLEVADEPNQSSQKQTKSSKQRITVQISEDVIERLKNAVYWTPGLTLASLAESAFSKAVDELEIERKTPFPKRKEELKTGRPIN
jgi:predicted DNA binding CopG/RHH family protein